MVETKDALGPVDPSIPTRERLIVALDFPNQEEALALVGKLGDEVTFYKVGWYLFFNEGKEFVGKLIHDYKKKVFLDLKMEDIDATVGDTVGSITDMGNLEFLTL